MSNLKLLFFAAIVGIASAITGGRVSPKGAHPYFASLRSFHDNDNDKHYCGGVIISPRTILTTATCVDKIPPSDIDVVVGSNNFNCGNFRYRAMSTKIYPEYNPQDTLYNLALLIVNHNIEFNEQVRPIELDAEELDGRLNVTIVGFGRYRAPFDHHSLTMQEVTEMTISNVDCRGSLAGFSRTPKTYEVCTYSAAGLGPCDGDTGGPIVRDGKLVGLASLRVFRCMSTFPDMNMRVAPFVSWIEDNKI